MQSRLQIANIFAAVMLALYGGFSILASMVLVAIPSMPYPVSVTTAI